MSSMIRAGSGASEGCVEDISSLFVFRTRSAIGSDYCAYRQRVEIYHAIRQIYTLLTGSGSSILQVLGGN